MHENSKKQIKKKNLFMCTNTKGLSSNAKISNQSQNSEVSYVHLNVSFLILQDILQLIISLDLKQ